MSEVNRMTSSSSLGSKKSKRTVIPQKLRENTSLDSDKWFANSMGLNLICVFFAFMFLYGFYAFFFWFWLTMLQTFGQQLLWFFFGLFVTTFGGMACFTIYSMMRQEIGWWAQQKPVADDASSFCGYALY